MQLNSDMSLQQFVISPFFLAGLMHFMMNCNSSLMHCSTNFLFLYRDDSYYKGREFMYKTRRHLHFGPLFFWLGLQQDKDMDKLIFVGLKFSFLFFEFVVIFFHTGMPEKQMNMFQSKERRNIQNKTRHNYGCSTAVFDRSERLICYGRAVKTLYSDFGYFAPILIDINSHECWYKSITGWVLKNIYASEKNFYPQLIFICLFVLSSRAIQQALL